MNGITASLNVVGSSSIDLDRDSRVSIDGPTPYDARSGGPQRQTSVFGPGGLGRFRYLDPSIQAIVVPGDANGAKANVLAPELTGISAWNTNPGTVVVTTSDGQTTNVTVDSASVMTVTGPSRDASGGLSFTHRLETKIKPFGRTFSLTVAS